MIINSNFFFITGFHPIDNDWWNGTRLSSVQRLDNHLIVDDANCGIFPLTFVWKLRNDLLPDFIFDPRGIRVKNFTSKHSIDDNIDNTVEKQKIVPNESLQPEQNNNNVVNTTKNKYLFYVKVIKTMEAQLDQEIDLPELDEILGVIKENDKLYYEGESLSRKIRGIFPKNFVVKTDVSNDLIENLTHNNQLSNPDSSCDIHQDSDNSSIGRSPVPPSFSPPPPPDILDILSKLNVILLSNDI